MNFQLFFKILCLFVIFLITKVQHLICQDTRLYPEISIYKDTCKATWLDHLVNQKKK